MIKKETQIPKVSVIIPVYNVEQYLRECLDSIVAQTLKDIEIICVNDGSHDGSLKILQQYASKNKRITIINQENQGLSIARNNGLKIAKGKYIHFLDSDDYLDLNTYENLYQRAEQFSLDMLFFKGQNFQDETREFLPSPYYSFAYLPDDWDEKVFYYKDCTSFIHKMAVTSTLGFYRHDFIKEHHLSFPEHLCFEDNVFFIKAILNAKRCSILQKVFLYRRIHSASITQNWDVHLGDYFNITELVLDYVKSTDDTLTEQYQTSYINTCFYFYKKYGYESKIRWADDLIKILIKYQEREKCLEFLDTCSLLYNEVRKNEDITKYKFPLTEMYIKSFKRILAGIPSEFHEEFLRKIKDYALNYNASDTMFDFYKQVKHKIDNKLVKDK